MTSIVAKRERTTAKRNFTYERRNLLRLIEGDPEVTTLTSSLQKLELLWKIIEEKHDAYLQTLNETDTEDYWLLEIRDDFEDAEEKGKKCITSLVRGSESTSSELITSKRLENERNLKDSE